MQSALQSSHILDILKEQVKPEKGLGTGHFSRYHIYLSPSRLSAASKQLAVASGHQLSNQFSESPSRSPSSFHPDLPFLHQVLPKTCEMPQLSHQSYLSTTSTISRPSTPPPSSTRASSMALPPTAPPPVPRIPLILPDPDSPTASKLPFPDLPPPRLGSPSSPSSLSRPASSRSISSKGPGRADEVDYVKCEVMANWLHSKQEEKRWVGNGRGEGVVLKRGRGVYTCAPRELEDDEEGFARAVRMLNVRVCSDAQLGCGQRAN